MDLKRLKHLVALADTRNFGRAAIQCHLTQSAFSRSIQAAEEEYGLQLFDRGPLEVTCTDAGAFVVEMLASALTKISTPLTERIFFSKRDCIPEYPFKSSNHCCRDSFL